MNQAQAIEKATASLPAFSNIQPDSIGTDIRALLQDNTAALARLLELQATPTWASLCAPLEDLNDRLSRAWSPIRHLHSVADTPTLRAAYSALLPEVVAYGTAQMQNDRLAAAYRQLRESAEFAHLTPAQRQVVEHALRDFRLGGIDLNEPDRTRLVALQQRLTQLSLLFEEHVLDATRAWHWHTETLEQLRGLPAHLLQLAAQNAAQQQRAGWVLTLDQPCYQATMLYAEDRALRAQMYAAYCTRASELGPNAGQFDNGPVIDEMLQLRHELATLLGYAHYAEYSLATKMAPSCAHVSDFLRELAAHSQVQAQQEMATLREFAREHLQLDTLEAWDVAFASERLRLHAFDISQETLRPYFPLARVLAGLFEIVHRLFGITIQPVTGLDTWHAEVAGYRIVDAAGELRGLFYLDLFARAGKRGGAWMDECLVRRVTPNGTQYPVAFLTCNFTPAVAGQPSLLTHEEVLTLFHEFGHGLHHLLTLVDEAAVSGINGVAWDAVELPSQFLENWCWEKEALAGLAHHHVTGDPLPEPIFTRMLAAKNFQSGLKMLRQVEFSLFDFLLHARDPADSAVQALLEEVRHSVAVLVPPAWNRFQHSFSHIFGGGYAAGYYSYKWAEVLAADAFARFEEEGVFNPAVGRDFRQHILEAGGATDAMTLFRQFRGRDPAPEALLRRSGLLP